MVVWSPVGVVVVWAADVSPPPPVSTSPTHRRSFPEQLFHMRVHCSFLIARLFVPIFFCMCVALLQAVGSKAIPHPAHLASHALFVFPLTSSRGLKASASASAPMAPTVNLVPSSSLHVSKPTWWLESRFHFSFAGKCLSAGLCGAHFQVPRGGWPAPPAGACRCPLNLLFPGPLPLPILPADYWDNSRSNFGALRVVNDDLVKPRAGFGAHPHRWGGRGHYILPSF